MSLWQEAFGDSREETAFYFRFRHRDENMLVMETDGMIAGMLSMLPLTLAAPGQRFPARYVFAVATKKERRGQGISTELLSAAHAQMREEGTAASLLVPADEGLFTFYGRRGYQMAFFVDELRLAGSDIAAHAPDGEVKDCGTGDYSRLRAAAFSGSRLFASWDEEALAFVIRSAKASGGGVLRLKNGHGEAAAVCEKRDGFLRVSELALSGMSWQEAMALVHRRFKAERYELRLPQGTVPNDSPRPFGMIHWLVQPPDLKGAAPYLALAKD